MVRLLLVLVIATLTGCATSPARVATASQVETRDPVTILISIDGFRADYLDRGVTPNLSALAANGVRAAMRPSYPSVTFPNHYTLVTGLRPDKHGIVSNRMEDPAKPGMVFTMASAEPFWWTQAEPIWITAEKAGVRTATMFWPGSNVDHGGVRPHDWMMFAQEISGRQRIDTMIDWLRRPAANRPRFLTLYFDTVDSAGHAHGPDAPQTNAALTEVDAQIGRLTTELAVLGQPANFVIAADHGMAATSPDRVIKLYEIADPKDYRVIYGGSYVAIEPQPEREAALAAALLKPHPHMNCARKGNLPPALHYGRNPRVPMFICVVETGWLANGAPPPPDRPITAGGAHGYDGAAPDMAALFIASGPGIRRGGTVAPFDNVHVYPLLARLIGVSPLPGDGDAAVLADIVKP